MPLTQLLFFSWLCNSLLMNAVQDYNQNLHTRTKMKQVFKSSSWLSSYVTIKCWWATGNIIKNKAWWEGWPGCLLSRSWGLIIHSLWTIQVCWLTKDISWSFAHAHEMGWILGKHHTQSQNCDPNWPMKRNKIDAVLTQGWYICPGQKQATAESHPCIQIKLIFFKAEWFPFIMTCFCIVQWELLQKLMTFVWCSDPKQSTGHHYGLLGCEYG